MHCLQLKICLSFTTSSIVFMTNNRKSLLEKSQVKITVKKSFFYLFLIRQRFEGYRCESDIPFLWRVELATFIQFIQAVLEKN